MQSQLLHAPRRPGEISPNELCAGCKALRSREVSPLRSVGNRLAAGLARSVAEFWRRRRLRNRPRHDPPRLRSWCHPLRSRQQLRPAVRLRGRKLRRNPAQGFRGLRNELIISTKAGWDMWPGPYGIGGSRKYLLASLDDSLKRMGLDYVDIFYAHRPWADCPLEETMGALVIRRAPGQGALRRHLQLRPRAHPRSRRHPQEHGRPAAHSSAVLLHAESLGRERPARHARRTRRRLHRLFSARPGPAHQQISQRRSRGLARQRRRLILERAS